MEIQQYRGGLCRTLAALKKGVVRIGFIGGSITDSRVEWNWPEPVSAWFVENFPGVRVEIENAAIGATGSDLAVFRAQRDLIERNCDLVFVEFAVNDGDTPAEQRMRSREGLIRKLLRGEGRDVVLAYTYYQPMYADMVAGGVPASIAEFEQLADHYRLGSVWMGLNALQEVQKGHMRWEEWLPDGLHPQHRGSLSYGQSVCTYLEHELLTQPGQQANWNGCDLPEPLNPANWEKAFSLAFDRVHLTGPWTVRRWVKYEWIDRVLHTAAPAAGLNFEFEGRGLLLGFDFGTSSAEFRYRMDGGGWCDSNRDRPDWVGAEGWFRTFLAADDLPRGRHTFELEVVHGNPQGSLNGTRYTGTTLNLGLIGVIP